MSIKIKVLVDDQEVKLPVGVVKVVVEGLGSDEDHELHEAFTHEGIIKDIIKDGEIVATSCGTYGELFASLFDEEEDSTPIDPDMRKHTLYFQVTVAVHATPGATEEQIREALRPRQMVIGASDPVLAHHILEVIRVDAVEEEDDDGPSG